jgi:hypothetical protein
VIRVEISRAFYFSWNAHVSHVVSRYSRLQLYPNWYFHRQGKGYREGTRKGLDISLGSREHGTLGGILIRSIERLENGPKKE